MAYHLYHETTPGSGSYTELNLAANALVGLRLRVAYDAPAQLSWSMIEAQHTAPIPRGTWIVFYDDSRGAADGGTFAAPIFEGRISLVDPKDNFSVEYTAEDPTAYAGQHCTVMSGAYSAGKPASYGNELPRRVYNSNNDADDDHAWCDDYNLTVGEMIADILDDCRPWLDDYLGAPSTGDPPYVGTDLSPLTFRPQDKIVIESASVREVVVDQLLTEWYPSRRMIFHPGTGATRRLWRIVDVLASTARTLTLNDYADAHRVLACDISASTERRYTAAKIFGPPKPTRREISTTTGDLDANWSGADETILKNNANGPELIGPSVVRHLTIDSTANASYRRIMRRLPAEEAAPSPDGGFAGIGSPLYVRTRFPYLKVKRPSNGQWYGVQGLRIDPETGDVWTSYPIYWPIAGATSAPYYEVPSEWVLVYAFLDTPLSVRSPSSGYSGTANTVYGLEAELKQYDEALAIGYENGVPVTSAARLAEFQKITDELHRAYRDVIYMGFVVLKGLAYDYLRLDRRINIAAKDDDGNTLTTGWESIAAPVTEVEFDFTGLGQTTLTFGSDLMDFLGIDVEQKKRFLQISAEQYRIDTGLTINIVRNGMSFAFGVQSGQGDEDAAGGGGGSPGYADGIVALPKANFAAMAVGGGR